MTKIEKIRDLHQFFIKKFRPKKPVILRFSKKMVYHGAYSYNNKKHYITLNARDNFATLCDSWAHEVGHSLEYNKYNKEEHSESWGAKFSIAYRIYLKWLETQS